MTDKEKRNHMESLASTMLAVYSFETAEKMTVVDLIILAHIYCNPGVTMTETMKAFPEIPLSTVQFSFVSFTRMDLIVKKMHPTDHKAKAVYLSSKGEKLVNAIIKAKG